MRLTTWTSIAVMGLVIWLSASPKAQAQEGRVKRPIQLADRSLLTADYVVRDRSIPRSSAPIAESASSAPTPSLADPYGFMVLLNNYRASAGLPPVAYDADLSAWAGQNNLAQNARGLGHHVNPGCLQNSGWNYSDACSLLTGWINSPAHRDTLLSNSISRFGIAYGPGPYWTLNAR